MTGQPTGGQWQWPPNAWQPPPVPIPPQAGPTRVGPPVAPVPEPPRRSRKAWAVAAGGTLAVLAAVLVMCGPGSGDDVRVVTMPDASPSATPSDSLTDGTPTPSPLPSPAPGSTSEAARASGDDPATPAAAQAGPDRTDGRHPTTPSAHPKSGRTPHPSPGTRPAPNGGAPAIPSLGPGTICDQAERIGRWPAGSEQARLCRGFYG
ncbi:hypothetical protein ACIG5E_20595 [Kitasatospora sp. NPDC053057]|uniref:hypothetical protein n=1 Tax=Kitasatospora sp. NPDC053057 TaxID=3364062 RepID=UPI0037C5DC4E